MEVVFHKAIDFTVSTNSLLNIDVPVALDWYVLKDSLLQKAFELSIELGADATVCFKMLLTID